MITESKLKKVLFPISLRTNEVYGFKEALSRQLGHQKTTATVIFAAGEVLEFSQQIDLRYRESVEIRYL